jgi:hypothetical protein
MIEALNWLLGKSPTANFIGITNAENTESITNEQLTQFRDSWLPNFESQFTDQNFTITEQVFAQVQEMLASAGSIKTDSSLEKVIKKAKSELDVLHKQEEASLKDTIKTETDSALNKIATVQGLEEWMRYYIEVERKYSALIEGTHKLEYVGFREKHQENPAYTKITFPFRHKKVYREIDGFKLGEARKRLLWFLFVGTIFTLPVVLSFVNNQYIFGLKNLFYINESAPLDYKLIALEKVRYLPALIIVSIGYAFSNRNYRILSNLREQYRHRGTVARTLQGIIRSIDKDDKDVDIKQKLVEIGAKAMFELKTIGHLTKRDSDNSPVNEIFQTFVK